MKTDPGRRGRRPRIDSERMLIVLTTQIIHRILSEHARQRHVILIIIRHLLHAVIVIDTLTVVIGNDTFQVLICNDMPTAARAADVAPARQALAV